MGKSTPDRAKIIDRFLAEPRDTEVHEVLPLIPERQVREAIEARYGLSVHATYQMSFEKLATAVETCEALFKSGLNPSEYDYDTWFRTRQASLNDDSPRLLLLRGNVEELTAFTERTVAQARKLG